ncbi:ABC transporter ATP-binding protein [Streptomyces sp. NPDC057654]|uniref:ABC transporter ATP-binding protein n=1 Tax=Streptomyces sp. NPDC057654 TaxID=3346196 RepID=UPI0036AC2DB7
MTAGGGERPGSRRAEEADGDAPDDIVVADGLTKKYGERTAVRGIDIRVRRGEFLGFLGPNGAGKSSTLRMVACVSPRTDGLLSVFGMDPDRHGPAIRARIGVVPQQDNLDTELSVSENLRVYARCFGIRRPEVRRKVAELLEFAALTDRAGAEVETLSGGMRRRLTIARALVNDPELVLLDEPTTGLDPQARHLLWDRLLGLKRAGVTLVLTTHYMDEVERLCDRVVIIDQGRIIEQGTPAALIERHAPPEVVELRYPPDRQAVAAEKLAGLCDRIETLPERLLLFVHNSEQALAEIYRSGLPPESSLVRRSTLEDVFLHLTGRSLDD